MIDRQNFFDQSVKSDMRTHDNIRKIVIGEADDYTTRCLLDYRYLFQAYYEMKAIAFILISKLIIR